MDSGAEVEFKDVLLVRSDDNTYIGRPTVEGALVKGVVEQVGQGDKVLVFKYKKKKQYRRTRGHRQHFSEVRIEKISVVQ
jgi:large subunit ribosomal protein L21